MKPLSRSTTRKAPKSRLALESLEARDVPATAFALLPSNSLIAFDTANPGTVVPPVAVTGLAAGENLVGIDFRPQNGQLYGLATDGAGGVRLYAISQRTGVATSLSAGPVQFSTGTGGVTVPVPITGANFGFDFNPVVDRIRVTTDTGANFRMNPNTGALVDFDNDPANGVQPDGNVNGGPVGVDGAAYTNNAPNVTVTTQYTLDSVTDTLFIQNPPNNGTQTNPLPVTLNGAPLDFTGVNGFDIPAGVAVTTAGAAATGRAFASLTTATTGTRLYGIELSTGVATDLGPIAMGTVPYNGLAIQSDLGGLPAIGLSADGTSLFRFNTAADVVAPSPAVPITGVTAGETLVGIDFRPATGQLFALGVDAAADTATLYRVDPQTGAATPIGTPGNIAFVQDDGTTPVDLPADAAGYGFDFNPTVDRIRVTTGTGLNFRLNQTNPAAVAVDGNTTLAGTQPDGGTIPTGVSAAAYTNSFGQPLAAAGQPPVGATTQYTLDAVRDTLFIQNPPNSGTQTNPLPVTFGGAPLDFTAVNGFDIPAGVRVATANGPAAGRGFALLTVGSTTSLYAIDLATGVATLAGPAGATLAGGSGLALGDAPVGTVAFAADTATVSEGAGTVTLTLVRTGGSVGSFTVDVTPGIDGSGPVTVTFADGQTTAEVVFTITDDDIDEVNQEVILTLANPTNGAVLGAPATTNLTITDDDGLPVVNVEVVTDAAEPTSPGTLRFSRTGDASQPLTVTYTVGGTATSGVDFQPLSGTVTFAAGQSEVFVTVTPIDDALAEGDETVVITLVPDATSTAGTSATLTITDNETVVPPTAGTIQFTAATVTGAEGGGSVLITLTRTGGTAGVVTVTVTATGGTATSGTDFTGVPATVTFADGQTTATLTIPILDDALVEGNETVVLALSNPTGGAALGTQTTTTLTITDNDTVIPPPAAGAAPFLVGGPAGGVARLLAGTGGTFALGNTVTFPGIAGNARVAVADVNGDGVPDYIGGAGPGGASRVVVIDGKSNAVLVSFDVFEAAFTGGVFVAAADLDGDGKAEVVVTPDQGGGPVVAVYRGSALAAGIGGQAAQIIRFFGIEDPAFRGGARPALGDLTGDGRADLVVSAGFLGGPRVALFDGASLTTGAAPVKLVGDFFAFEDTLRNGSFVAAGDITGDGRADLIFGGGPGGGPRVRVFDGAALLAAGPFGRLDAIPAAQRANFFAGDANLRGGVRVAAHDADDNADNRAELVIGSGEGEASRVRLYRAATLLAGGNPSPDQEFDPFGAVQANGVFVG